MMPGSTKPAARDAAIPAIVNAVINGLMHRHLIAIYAAFDGDPVQAIVLGEVARHNVEAIVASGRTERTVSDALARAARQASPQLVPANAHAVAQATGIPRETVRRKVDALAGRGWLRRGADGGLYVTERSLTAFSELHFRGLTDLMTAASGIQTVLTDDSRTPTRGRARGRPAPARRRRG